MHDSPNQTIAEAFSSRLCEFNDHQVHNQGKGRGGHRANNVFTKEEILISDHIEHGEEGWDGVRDGQAEDCKENRLAPAGVEEVLLVDPSCQHHYQHGAHEEHLLLQDLHLSPLAANHGPCSCRDGGKELHDEGEDQHGGQAFVLDELP